MTLYPPSHSEICQEVVYDGECSTAQNIHVETGPGAEHRKGSTSSRHQAILYSVEPQYPEEQHVPHHIAETYPEAHDYDNSTKMSPKTSGPSKTSKSSKGSKTSKHGGSSSRAAEPPTHYEVCFQLQSGGRSVKFNVPRDGNCYRAYLVHSCGHDMKGTISGETVSWTVQTYRDHEGECAALGHELCDYRCVDPDSVCDVCRGKGTANALGFVWNC